MHTIPLLKTRARKLRREMTEVEKRLWQKIRNYQLGYYFRRQVPIGRYIADFCCLEMKLIIELDGSQHQERQSDDHSRTAWFEANGYKVLRFWNNAIVEDMESVLQVIITCLKERAFEGSGPLPR
jgi:very-short-patch-repair endonuclease